MNIGYAFLKQRLPLISITMHIILDYSHRRHKSKLIRCNESQKSYIYRINTDKGEVLVWHAVGVLSFAKQSEINNWMDTQYSSS